MPSRWLLDTATALNGGERVHSTDFPDLRDALERSCNPYFESIANGLGAQALGMLDDVGERRAQRLGLKREIVSDAILYIVTRPRHVAINEVLIRPTRQPRYGQSWPTSSC